MIDPMLVGSKKSTGETVPAVTLAKSSIADWLPWIAPEQLLHLRWRRLKRRQLGGELEDRQHLFVAGSW